MADVEGCPSSSRLSSSSSSLYRLGDVVYTTYGAGVIVRKRLEEEEDDKDRADADAKKGQREEEETQREQRGGADDDKEQSDVAVAVRFYHVRIWRIPGQSMAASSLAILRPSAILYRLPAAPGMVTKLLSSSERRTAASAATDTEKGNDGEEEEEQDDDDEFDDDDDASPSSSTKRKVLVHAYRKDRNVFLVSSVLSGGDDGAEAKKGTSSSPRSSSVSASFSDDDDENDDENDDVGSDHSNRNKQQRKKRNRLSLLKKKLAVRQVPSIEEMSRVSLREVPADKLAAAPSAKFYPVLETLVERADDAVAAAAAAVQKSVRAAAPAARELLSAGSKVAAAAADRADDWKEKRLSESAIAGTAAKAERAAAQVARDVVLPAVAEENVKQVLTMLHDKDVTVLLRECRERLRQLAATDVTDVSAQTRRALEKTGIYFLSDENDDDKDDAASKEGGGDGAAVAVTAAATAAAEDDSSNNKKKTADALKRSVESSRRAALRAVEDLLKQADVDPERLQAAVRESVDLPKLRETVAAQFTSAFDHLQAAAKSDRGLHDLFQNLQERTAAWQEVTGRLMETRSANLFLEGASRLQVRAKALLEKNSPNATAAASAFAGADIGSALTKAFTEGDAALARLKTIELSNAVKNRLVKAIEVRSESMGGLDGIIAGALTTVKRQTTRAAGVAVAASSSDGGSDLKGLLSGLQKQASSMTADAHETLLTVLSHQSAYRDVALLRLEVVLQDLSMHFQGDLTAEDLQRIAAGRGGTARLFEPVAKRAMRQIERQLDVAEEQVRRQFSAAGKKHADLVLQVLARIRKIMSGQLTLQAVMDELVSLLNDDQVVAVGETVLERSEHVLDAIEGAVSTAAGAAARAHSQHDRVVTGALHIAEKAGLTKDSVMEEISKLDVNRLLDTTASAVTDERARRQLLSSATDAALDFLLKILPSMPVPPLDGVRDGLLYTISNLSMEGFKVRKENIQIQLAGMRATRRKKKRNKNNKNSSTVQIEEITDGEAEATNHQDGGVAVASSSSSRQSPSPRQSPRRLLRRRRSSGGSASTDNVNSVSSSDDGGGADDEDDDDDDDEEETAVTTTASKAGSSTKATELLIIDVCGISAAFENAAWSFEQTYLPYLKGNGAADVKMSDGAIRLQFELRKRRKRRKEPETDKDGNSKDGAAAPASAPGRAKEDDDGDDGGDGSSEWEPVLCLHDRTCSIGSVELTLQGQSRLTWLVNKLAAIFKGPLRDYVVKTIVYMLSQKSGWILQRLNTVLAPYWDLILRTSKLKMDDLLEADKAVVVEAEEPTERSLQVELVWRERLPLGMNLLVNDEDGLKVVDFPRGSQARAVCLAKQLDPDGFKGARVVGVNGSLYDDQEELFEALKDPGRPKTVRFALADTEDAERVRKFVETLQESSEHSVGDPVPAGAVPRDEKDEPHERTYEIRRVEFPDEGELGIQFTTSLDGAALQVAGFVEGPDGILLAAERTNRVRVGDLLTHVNDEPVMRIEPDSVRGSSGTGSGSGSGSSAADTSCARSKRAVDVLQAAAARRPLTLSFSEPYLHQVVVTQPVSGPGVIENSPGGPNELVLEERLLERDDDDDAEDGDEEDDENREPKNRTGTEKKKQSSRRRRIVLTGYNNVSGSAETSGIMIGDYLVFVNGLPVGAGIRWSLGDREAFGSQASLDEVNRMLGDSKLYPIGLTFARPVKRQEENSSSGSAAVRSWTSTFKQAVLPPQRKITDREVETFCVTSDEPGRLGCCLGVVDATDLVVTDFVAVPGTFQRALRSNLREAAAVQGDQYHLAVDWINGQFVPSYASGDLVRSALQRSWRNDRRVELRLSDDERKRWLRQTQLNQKSSTAPCS